MSAADQLGKTAIFPPSALIRFENTVRGADLRGPKIYVLLSNVRPRKRGTVPTAYVSFEASERASRARSQASAITTW